MDNHFPERSLFDRIKEGTVPSGPARGNGRLQIDDSDGFPLLTALLTTVPPAAKGAKPGRVAFFVQNGILTCCLSCPGLLRVAFTDAGGFQDALCRVERQLAEGKVEWKEDKQKWRK